MATTKMPKKKGGAVFPRIDLKEAVDYARKLVSKTHTGPQEPSILFPGVFGVRGNRAEVRASALKQYGLMKGTAKSGFTATDEARALVHATDEDRVARLQTSALLPTVFRGLFDTFQGDRVSKAKIRQQAATLRVHPDNLEACSDIFVSSVVFAGLATAEGDDYDIGRKTTTAPETAAAMEAEESEDVDRETQLADVEDGRDEDVAESGGTPTGRAVIQVNVTLDSSLDTEKLERQLQLLRRYGAL